MARILLEIIATTVDDCVAAESGGADRIELCAAITTGGLTPSLGTLIEAKKRVRVPVMAMVRPRAGGFCYSEEEFATMRRDAALLVEQGADGLVFGLLHADGTVDTTRCGKLLETAHSRQTVFHRAYDAVPEAMAGLDQLIDLGFTRVLTSGQKKTALEGLERLQQIMARAQGRIEVLPGGGVRSHNVGQLVEATGCTQVHLTAFSARCDASLSTSPIRFGSIPGAPSPSYECVDREAVRRMRETLDAMGGAAQP
ncbi:MAG TPA: copper homeostasis protein CutC [Candidatus Angelobacter sp.]|nr:copper homeostasis protein CutC [Candidatus Angelobacter sp.]